LNSERGGGGWCPKQPLEKGIREYLQVDLGQVHVVSGIQTQGRNNKGRGLEYVEEYTIEYWRPGLPEWHTYRTWDLKEVSTKKTYVLSFVKIYELTSINQIIPINISCLGKKVY